MNRVHASIYLYLPQFLSSVLYIFLNTGLLPPYLLKVKFIPRYFIFLVAIVSGTFSLVSLSDSSLLVYKNAVATSLAQV